MASGLQSRARTTTFTPRAAGSVLAGRAPSTASAPLGEHLACSAFHQHPETGGESSGRGRVQARGSPPPCTPPSPRCHSGFCLSVSLQSVGQRPRVWMHTWTAGLLLAPLQTQAGLRWEGPGLRKHKLESLTLLVLNLSSTHHS